MAGTNVLTLALTAIAVQCDACGHHGVLTRETGDVTSRLGMFARQHLDPRAVAVRTAANGLDMGWCETE